MTGLGLVLVLLVLVVAQGRLLPSDAADTLRKGRVVVDSSFAPQLLISHLKDDMDALDAAGLFHAAGSGGRDIDSGPDPLRRALWCDPVGRPDRSVGNWEAFFALWERLDMIRCELAAELDQELMEEMELHYVNYPEGGYYKRHLDEVLEDNSAAHRRCISFICYLTAPDWEEKDGGQLRIFDTTESQEASETTTITSSDIPPLAGTLVLFDSTQVEHEVLPTQRDRRVLIGWFQAPATRHR